MAGISDTSPEAERVLVDLLRRMPFERKWRQVGFLYHTGRQLHAAGFRLRHPDATLEDIHADWAKQARVGFYPPPPGGARMFGPEEATLVLRHLVGVLDQLAIRYALSGSWASSLYGPPRLTQDADLCVEPFPGKEAELCAALGDDYYVPLATVEKAVRNRTSFNVIYTPTAFKVDLFMAKPRIYDQSLLERRCVRHVGGPDGVDVQMVSAEDVILLKLEWYRLGDEVSSKQWDDILGVFRVQGPSLDQAYLDRWAEALGVTDLLDRARQELAQGTQP